MGHSWWDIYPISKKIFRISSRTFRRGCKDPPSVGIPSASKLYFLKEAVFHAPLNMVEYLEDKLLY